MDETYETCLELDLGLGLSEYRQKRDIHSKHNKHRVLLDLSISHLPSAHVTNSSSSMETNVGEDETRRNKNIISNCSIDKDDTSFSENCSRKKLRLARDQTNLLEDSFKKHCTLNMAQKQALAQQLNLKPRQVEVWFQNRRARTKLKQTELNCQFLKRNCERLTEENRRLKKEMFDLQSSVNAQRIALQAQSLPLAMFYRFPQAEALRKCEEINRTRGGSGGKQVPAAAAVGEVVLREPKPNDQEQRVE